MSAINFTPDRITAPSVTNSKGVEIKLGDLVSTKGSKIVRRVQGIGARGARGVRHDGVDIAFSAWLDIEKLTVVGSVL